MIIIQKINDKQTGKWDLDYYVTGNLFTFESKELNFKMTVELIK